MNREGPREVSRGHSSREAKGRIFGCREQSGRLDGQGAAASHGESFRLTEAVESAMCPGAGGDGGTGAAAFEEPQVPTALNSNGPWRATARYNTRGNRRIR